MLVQGASLERDISPPPRRRRTDKNDRHTTQSDDSPAVPSLAAIEAGQAVIKDHLAYFSARFQAVAREAITLQPSLPRLSIAEFKDVYQRNVHPHGHHFVVHQHDHPIAGVHYDLRLQFSQSSTISFAIPYGLPGNTTSIRPNRMAIETRVHNLWNNLIESASRATGSLLIWDTGEYEVLPYREVRPINSTDDETSDSEQPAILSANERLFAAFQDKHIRLRLHGRRLPAHYTITLRLPKNNQVENITDPTRKRRRRIRPTTLQSAEMTESESEETIDEEMETDVANASDEEEEASIRANNAYTGAINTIGSVHQRRWFLSLDKKNSVLEKPFFVMGRDIERSVVTGRSADDVLVDEGVTRFIGRKMWRPVTE